MKSRARQHLMTDDEAEMFRYLIGKTEKEPAKFGLRLERMRYLGLIDRYSYDPLRRGSVAYRHWKNQQRAAA